MESENHLRDECEIQKTTVIIPEGAQEYLEGHFEPLPEEQQSGRFSRMLEFMGKKVVEGFQHYTRRQVP